jgi:hypothetical protein
MMSRLIVGFLCVAAALLALGGHVLQTRSESDKPPVAREPEQKGFAADREPPPVAPSRFDAGRAMKYLEEVCKIGPRISGTEGMKKQQELVKKHFEDLGAKVEFQRFTARQKSQAKPVEMANLIISWHPERQRRVILCSHYDTRPIADQEPNRSKWTEPFVSANDGGSGVALLMELAHHVKDLKTTVGVDFVLFDGEEYIFDSDRDKYFFGSEHFGRTYREDRPKHRYVAAVLLDMIAGKNAHFPVESNSLLKAGALVQEIWAIAAELKCTTFQYREGPSVLDDHLALNDAGIPAVDIIDFNYPHWHRLSDVPANCSKESLTEVARVLTVWLQRVK